MKVLVLLPLLVLVTGCSTLSLGQEDQVTDCSPDSTPICLEVTKGSKVIRQELEQLLMRHEGFRAHPYDDRGTTSIGYGRNLTTNGISESEALELLRHDIDRIESHLSQNYPVFDNLTNNRRAVLISMTYILGERGISDFVYMWMNIERHDYQRAALEIYLSDMCGQIGNRCKELADMMEHG